MPRGNHMLIPKPIPDKGMRKLTTEQALLKTKANFPVLTNMFGFQQDRTAWLSRGQARGSQHVLDGPPGLRSPVCSAGGSVYSGRHRAGA